MERIFTDERKNEKERNNSPWRACFPRAVVILLYIFIFFDIADADGGGAGMGTDGDADGPNFIHHIEAFCKRVWRISSTVAWRSFSPRTSSTR